MHTLIFGKSGNNNKIDTFHAVNVLCLDQNKVLQLLPPVLSSVIIFETKLIKKPTSRNSGTSSNPFFFLGNNSLKITIYITHNYNFLH